jgi:hypothetical protein
MTPYEVGGETNSDRGKAGTDFRYASCSQSHPTRKAPMHHLYRPLCSNTDARARSSDLELPDIGRRTAWPLKWLRTPTLEEAANSRASANSGGQCHRLSRWALKSSPIPMAHAGLIGSRRASMRSASTAEADSLWPAWSSLRRVGA